MPLTGRHGAALELGTAQHACPGEEEAALKLIVLFVTLLTVPAWAGEPTQGGERPPLPDGTVPMTDKPQGPAKTALPEQAASPTTKEERPGSAASENAERIK